MTYKWLKLWAFEARLDGILVTSSL